MHNNSPSLLDHMYTNDHEHHLIPGVLTFDISDHLPTFLIIKSIKNTVAPQIWKRDFKRFNLELFIDDLDKKLKTIKTELTDPDQLFTTFFDTFLQVADYHAPLKKLSRKETKRLSKPWLTKGILISVRTKNRLFRRRINHHNNIEYLIAYKKYNNILTHVKKKVKSYIISTN